MRHEFIRGFKSVMPNAWDIGMIAGLACFICPLVAAMVGLLFLIGAVA